jgi:hypothetical protein
MRAQDKRDGGLPIGLAATHFGKIRAAGAFPGNLRD